MKFLLSQEQAKKWLKNLLFFTAPILAIFFYQLSTGVDFKASIGVALLALYGLMADYFKKLRQ
jgi:hypothetical protein